MIFALSLIPIAGIAGMAIDYTNAVRLNDRLKGAADAAALSHVRDYALSLNMGLANSKAQDVFSSQLQKTTPLENPTISFTVQSTDTTYTTTATYSGRVKTWFGGILKKDYVNLTGMAKASYNRNIYKNFYFIIDTSESMGLAATEGDINRLRNVTNEPCALACHRTQEARLIEGSNEIIARANNITLRLDVVREAVKSVLDYVKSTSGSGQYIRFSLYRMRGDLVRLNDLYGLPALSSNYDALKMAAEGLELDGTEFGGLTLIKSALDTVGATLTDSGDGSTQATAQNYVFLLTDGVHDGLQAIPGSVWCYHPQHCTGAVDPAWCDQFKLKKATVGVVYTTYLDPLHSHYNLLVRPFAFRLQPNLKSCASPDYFLQGTYGPEISSAMMRMFQQSVGRVRLSQ